MANEPADVRKVWQAQSEAPFRMSLDDIRDRIEKFDANLRRRHYVAYGASVFVIASTLWWMIIFPNLIQRIGAVLTLLGAGYIVYQLLLNEIESRAAVLDPAETAHSGSLEFYRAKLERQRDFHRGIWFWSRLVIFAPGPIVFLLGTAVAHPEAARHIRIQAAVFAFLAFLSVPLNLGMARRYQQKINELEVLRKDHS